MLTNRQCTGAGALFVLARGEVRSVTIAKIDHVFVEYKIMKTA